MIKNKKTMRKLFFLFITLFIAVTKITADDKTSFVTNAPEVVANGDQFRLTFNVNTQNIREFRAPSIKDFDVLMGPNRSFSQSIINGVSSSSVTYTYILMAQKQGIFVVPGATAIINGKATSSNSVKIKVLPSDQGGENTNSNNNSSGSNNSSTGKPTQSSSGSGVSSNDLFVIATVSKSNVYEQEALLLSYKIYTLVDIARLNNANLPDFKGFHSQEISLPQQKQYSLEHYNGRNYRTILYRQFVLFPQQSGKLEIDPAKFDIGVAKAVVSDDPFDAFFNGGSNYVEVSKKVVTPKITVNVMPLPAGKPTSFSGGVGEFSISSSINTKELKTNDALTIKLIISGVGNLKLINSPEVAFPKDFETYDPKVDNKFSLTKDGLSGSKVIEYLAVPRNAGTYKIPSVEFSYFDLKTKGYKTLKTDGYEIKVEKGAGNADQVIANFTNKEDLKVLGNDIHFIKMNDTTIRPKGDFFFGSLICYLWYIIPLCLFIIFIIIYRKQAVENANVAKVRTKKANKVATKRMKLAGKLLSENKKEQFYDEVLRALWGYISDKLNIPVSKLSKDNVEYELNKYGVESDLIKEFIDTLNHCEFARYAPGDESATMDKVYSSAVEVMSKMENSIKH